VEGDDDGPAVGVSQLAVAATLGDWGEPGPVDRLDLAGRVGLDQALRYALDIQY